MTPHRIASLLVITAALLSPVVGCTIGKYNPPPSGARSAPPAKAPPPDAPPAFVFSQPAKTAPAPAPDPAMPIGKKVTVQYKSQDNQLIAPVEGVLQQVSADWVVVKGPTLTHYVPRATVLRIEVSEGE